MRSAEHQLEPEEAAEGAAEGGAQGGADGPRSRRAAPHPRRCPLRSAPLGPLLPLLPGRGRGGRCGEREGEGEEEREGEKEEEEGHEREREGKKEEKKKLQNKIKKPKRARRAQTLRQGSGARPSGGERAGRGPSPGGLRPLQHIAGAGGPRVKRGSGRSEAQPGQGIPADARGWLAAPAECPCSRLRTPGGPDAPVRGGGCRGDAHGAASPASCPTAGPQLGTPPRRGEQPRAAVSSHHTSLLAPLGARQSYLIPSTASPAGSSSIHPCGTELGSSQPNCGC